MKIELSKPTIKKLAHVVADALQDVFAEGIHAFNESELIRDVCYSGASDEAKVLNYLQRTQTNILKQPTGNFVVIRNEELCRKLDITAIKMKTVREKLEKSERFHVSPYPPITISYRRFSD